MPKSQLIGQSGSYSRPSYTLPAALIKPFITGRLVRIKLVVNPDPPPPYYREVDL